MRLTAKLVLVIMLGVALLTTAHGYLIVQRQGQQLKDTMELDAAMLGRALEREVHLRWLEEGQTGVLQFLRQANQLNEEVVLRWVYLDAPPGAATHPLIPPEQLQGLGPTTLISVTRRTETGEGFLHTYYPMDVGRGAPTYLEISNSLAEVDRSVRETIYQTIGLMLAILFCGLFVTLVGVRFVGQPLEKLIEKTKRIGEGDFSQPLDLRGEDEFGQLAEALNQMCSQLAESQDRVQAETAARLAAVEQLRHVDRLKTIGRLASGVAHELGTPLNVVSGRAELIASGRLPEEDVHKSAKTIKSEADRMTATIRQLLDFARRSRPQRSPTDLRSLIQQATELLAPLAQKNRVTISFSAGDRPSVSQVDGGQIQQIVLNLLVNAMQALPDGGQVSLELQERQASPPEDAAAPQRTYYCILVKDEGVGMDQETIDHIFEPFFTTKDVGQGTGLGLSVSYGIAQEHGGWIDVTSEPGKGTCFTVFLPKETASCPEES
jgi:signal transduction histidine kinase